MPELATTKAERLRELLASGALRQGRIELRCRQCALLLLRFTPPVELVVLPCRRCGTWNSLSAEPDATGS